MQGQLGQKLIPDLIREIAHRNGSGLLRLSRGKSIKAVFFDSGRLTYAISNLSTDQLEYRLIREGLVTLSQVEKAKERASKPHKLGSTLVEMGMLDDSQMRSTVRDQVLLIIMSLFDWTDGDYTLDERIRASHEVTLDIPVADVLLEGARHSSTKPEIAELLAPSSSVVVRSKTASVRAEAGKLLPAESYILSRIDSPTTVSDVGPMSGLSEGDAHSAVCALVAAGFLKLADRDEGDREEPVLDEELDSLRDEINRRLFLATSEDFYDVLGVTRHATTAEIKAAYYQLAKKFHPDRYHQQDNDEIRAKLETLFGLITQAYDTLSQGADRAAYDEKIRKNPAAAAQGAAATARIFEHPGSDRAVSHEDRAPSGDLNPSGEAVASQASQPVLDSAVNDAIAHSRSGPQLPPAQQAELYYQQGRARFERKEYHAAVHLLREAIKLDPSRAAYHYHLGIALIRNPRTRREAEEHLSKAAELEPYNAQVRVKLGLLYKEAGLNKRAEHYFREALQLDPENRLAGKEVKGKGAKGKADAQSIWKADMGSIAKRIFKK